MVCPSPLGDTDLAALLRLCVQAVNKVTGDAEAKVVAVADTFVVSHAFRLKLIEDAKPAITAMAKAAAVQCRATRKAAAAAVPQPEPEKPKAGKGKKVGVVCCRCLVWLNLILVPIGQESEAHAGGARVGSR